VSPEAQALGVPKLKAEKSNSLTLGLGIKPDSDTSLTIDYYNIKVKDRIILSDPLGPSGDATQALDKQLASGGLAALSFFVNGMDTRTEGFDYVASRKNIPLADGKLTLNLSGNITTKNERSSNVFQPAGLPATTSVIGATDEALMFTSRPKYKTILGMELDYSKVNFSLNNTVFGPTRFRNADLADLDPSNLNNLEVEFKTKVVTDFGMNYNLSKDMTLSFNINNLLNVTPEWRFKALNAKGQAVIDDKTILASSGMTPIQTINADITFAGRYSMMTYDGSHFSQLGRTFAASLNYRF
jgi:iron complex outermembrane receptor protein